MAQTISKHIAEGFGKGELYAALAYDAGDAFGGMAIKALMLNSTGRISFLDANAYIYASSSGVLEITATTINLNGAFAFTGTDKLALGTNASPLTLTAGSPIFTLYSTDSNTTTTNSQAFLVKQVVTGIGGYGGRALFHTYSNVASGTNLKALRCFTEFGDSGSATGLASGLGVELKMPNATPAGAASYCVLQLDYVAGGTDTVTTGSLSGRNASFIKASNSGDADGDFDDNGFLLFLAGLTDGTGNLLYNNTLRIGVGTTTWYLPMSSAQGSFTTAYPIVTTYATNAIDISTCAIGINFSGTPTIGINMPGGGADYTPILIGEKTNLADGGFKVAGSGDDSGGIQVYADDSGDAAAGEVISPFRVRYLLSVGQTGGVTQTGLFAQMRTLGTTGAPLVLNTGSWRTSYVFSQLGGNTIQGGAEITGMNQATTLAGNMIVTSGSFTGIDINIAGSGTITNNSVCAALLIRSKDTPVWTNGIQIADAGALTGISIGDCTTAINLDGDMTTGINIATGCTKAIQCFDPVFIGTDAAPVTITSVDYQFCVYATAQGTTSGWFNPVVFDCETKSGYAMSGTGQMVTVQGYARLVNCAWSAAGGACGISSVWQTTGGAFTITAGTHSAMSAGLQAHSGLTIDSTAEVCGLYVFNQINKHVDVTDQQYTTGILIGTFGDYLSLGSAIKVTTGVDNLLELPAQCAMSSYNGNSATAGNPDGYIRISMAGTTRYIWTYDNVT